MSKIKTTLILTLAVLAVYQTWQLWFVHITNRSVITYITALFNPTVPDGLVELTRPMRVVYGNGCGQFDMRYGVRVDAAEDAFVEIMRRGVFGGVREAALVREEILSGPVVFYEYAFPLRADVFEQTFGRRGNTFLYDHGLVFFEAAAVTAEGAVFFYGGEAWVFSAAADAIQLPDFTVYSTLYFVHEGGQFLPRTRQGWWHRPVAMENPYANRSGLVQLESVNAQVSHFFTNPAVRNPRMEDNVITISAPNTVVRFLPYNILEFNYFQPIRRRGAPDFVANFSAALAFLQQDPHMVNRFYLAGHETRGRTHVFWFNYIIGGENNGFPLHVPAGGWGSSHEPLPYPLEVVVDYGRVTRYRRLAYTFGLDAARQLMIRQSDMYPSEAGGRVVLGYPPVQGMGLEVRY
jgi:hypothetical protein